MPEPYRQVSLSDALLPTMIHQHHRKSNRPGLRYRSTVP